MNSRPWLQHYDKGVPSTLVYPEVTLARFLCDTADASPEAIAITLNDTDITYGELNVKTNGFAHALLSLGIRKGDRVALLLPNTPTYVISYYAALKTGALVANLNVGIKGDALALLLRDAGARILVTLDLFLENIRPVLEQTPVEQLIIHSVFGLEKKGVAASGKAVPLLIFNELVAAHPQTETEAVVRPDDIAVLQYTGGTTGTPKSASLTHRNLVASISQIASWIQISDAGNAPVICILPFFHVFGMTACLNLSVYKGYRMILVPMFDWSSIVTFLEMIKTYRPISFPAIPAIWAALVSYPDTARYPLDAIAVATSGGAPLPGWVQEKYRRLTGRRIVEAYGLSESASATHLAPFNAEMPAGSIGVPLPDTDAKIVDLETGKTECPVGEVGELIVRGPQVMQGYWRNPQQTAAALRSGWLYTGDLARMDAEGFFYIVDRKDDLIITSGFNVYPSDIEAVLEQHPDVDAAAAVGMPDRIKGEIVAAFVVPAGSSRIDRRLLAAHCRKYLPDQAVPRTFRIVDAIPLSPLGKPLRRILRDQTRRSGTGGASKGGPTADS